MVIMKNSCGRCDHAHGRHGDGACRMGRRQGPGERGLADQNDSATSLDSGLPVGAGRLRDAAARGRRKSRGHPCRAVAVVGIGRFGLRSPVDELAIDL